MVLKELLKYLYFNRPRLEILFCILRNAKKVLLSLHPIQFSMKSSNHLHSGPCFSIEV